MFFSWLVILSLFYANNGNPVPDVDSFVFFSPEDGQPSNLQKLILLARERQSALFVRGQNLRSNSTNPIQDEKPKNSSLNMPEVHVTTEGSENELVLESPSKPVLEDNNLTQPTIVSEQQQSTQNSDSKILQEILQAISLLSELSETQNITNNLTEHSSSQSSDKKGEMHDQNISQPGSYESQNILEIIDIIQNQKEEPQVTSNSDSQIQTETPDIQEPTEIPEKFSTETPESQAQTETSESQEPTEISESQVQSDTFENQVSTETPASQDPTETFASQIRTEIPEGQESSESFDRQATMTSTVTVIVDDSPVHEFKDKEAEIPAAEQSNNKTQEVFEDLQNVSDDRVGAEVDNILTSTDKTDINEAEAGGVEDFTYYPNEESTIEGAQTERNNTEEPEKVLEGLQVSPSEEAPKGQTQTTEGESNIDEGIEPMKDAPPSIDNYFAEEMPGHIYSLSQLDSSDKESLLGPNQTAKEDKNMEPTEPATEKDSELASEVPNIVLFLDSIESTERTTKESNKNESEKAATENNLSESIHEPEATELPLNESVHEPIEETESPTAAYPPPSDIVQDESNSSAANMTSAVASAVDEQESSNMTSAVASVVDEQEGANMTSAVASAVDEQESNSTEKTQESLFNVDGHNSLVSINNILITLNTTVTDEEFLIVATEIFFEVLSERIKELGPFTFEDDKGNRYIFEGLHNINITEIYVIDVAAVKRKIVKLKFFIGPIRVVPLNGQSSEFEMHLQGKMEIRIRDKGDEVFVYVNNFSFNEAEVSDLNLDDIPPKYSFVYDIIDEFNNLHFDEILEDKMKDLLKEPEFYNLFSSYPRKKL